MRYIYATCYNNATIIESCLNSIVKLQPYMLYVVDNYSTDKSYEILCKIIKKGIVIRKKCSRGRGRDLALKLLFKFGKPKKSDTILYIDLDTIYTKKFVSYVKANSNTDGITVLAGVSKAGLNKRLFWRDLNNGEIWERLARAKSKGTKVYVIKNFKDKAGEYLTNVNRGNERMYAKGSKLYLRKFKNLVDSQRSRALPSFMYLYNAGKEKRLFNLIMWPLAYFIANFLGVYRYSKDCSNVEYVLDV